MCTATETSQNNARLCRTRSHHTFQKENNKGADQTIDAQAGLCLCCLHATKTGFLASWPICKYWKSFIVQEKRLEHHMSQNEGYYGICGQLQPKFVHGDMFPMQMFTVTVKVLTLSMLMTSILYFIKKILSGIISDCQTIWIQIKTDNLLLLIWVQIVCKVYRQTTKVAASKVRVKAVYTMCTKREFSGIINLFS